MFPAAVHRANAAKFASWESIPRQQAYGSVFVAFIRSCRCNLSKRWAVVHERNYYYYYYYYGRKWRWINSPEVIVRPMCALFRLFIKRTGYCSEASSSQSRPLC